MNIRTSAKFALALVYLVLTNCFSGNGQTLEDYLSEALSNSPFLKDFSAQVQSNAVDSLKILAGLKPQVGAGADLMYPPAIGKFAYDSAITDGGHYAAMVRVNQPLFSRKIAEGHLQSVSIQKLMVQNNFKVTESELKETVTAQYITACADLSQVRFEKVILNMLNDQQLVLKHLVDSGIYQQTDLLNLAVNISSSLISGKEAYRQYKNDLAILNLLCGIHDTSMVELKTPDLVVRKTFDIGTSPRMIQFRIDSLKGVNDHLIVDMNYKPRLEVFADAGINAISPKRIPYNLGTSFGLSFTMPLYDGKQRLLEHRKISFAENSRALFQSFFENQYAQERDQLIEQLRLTEELISDRRNQLNSFEKLIVLYKVEINNGMVRWLDFIAVVNNFAQASNELVHAEISRLQIINQLNYLK